MFVSVNSLMVQLVVSFPVWCTAVHGCWRCR